MGLGDFTFAILALSPRRLVLLHLAVAVAADARAGCFRDLRRTLCELMRSRLCRFGIVCLWSGRRVSAVQDVSNVCLRGRVQDVVVAAL